MVFISISELPGSLRVKLSDSRTEDLWSSVEEAGGVKQSEGSHDYLSSTVYNWRSKDLALPLDFVRQFLEDEQIDVNILKGSGSSGMIRNPSFPLEVSEELLTRVNASVKVSSEGTPMYITRDRSLVERFSQLLESLGEVDYTVYRRDSRFELRYPKFLHEMFSSQRFERDTGALVDEEGRIQNGNILFDGRKVPVQQFDKNLFSRRKAFELALERGNSEKITELMAEESDKVQKLIRS